MIILNVWTQYLYTKIIFAKHFFQLLGMRNLVLSSLNTALNVAATLWAHIFTRFTLLKSNCIILRSNQVILKSNSTISKSNQVIVKSSHVIVKSNPVSLLKVAIISYKITQLTIVNLMRCLHLQFYPLTYLLVIKF